MELLIDWLIKFNFVYQRYPAKLLIPVVDVLISPERKCNIHVYDTALQPINPRDIILTSLFNELTNNKRLIDAFKIYFFLLKSIRHWHHFKSETTAIIQMVVRQDL